MPWALSLILSIAVPLVAIALYVGRRILRALVAVTGWEQKRTRRRMLWFFLFINLLPVVYLLAYLVLGRAGTSLFNGDSFLIDFLFSYPFWMGLAIVAQMFLVFLPLDFLRLLFLPLLRKHQERWHSVEPRLVLAIAGGVLCYGLFTIVTNTWTVRTVERDVQLPEGYERLDGVRIALISDVQADGRTGEWKLKRYVDKVNALKPDLILNAGDVVTGGRNYISLGVSMLGRLQAPHGVISVVGDHDFFSDKGLVVEGLRENGITVVEDSTLILHINDTPLAITGVTYTYRQKPKPEALRENGEAVGDAYKLFLVHQPAERLVEFAADHGYHLFLAGHTHGGGIALGIPGVSLVAPASFESRYVSGFYEVGGMLVGVTNGLGFTLAPIRYHAPAEIVVLRLYRVRSPKPTD